MKISLYGTFADPETTKSVQVAVSKWREKQRMRCTSCKVIGFIAFTWIMGGALGFAAGYLPAVLGNWLFFLLTMPLAAILQCTWHYPLYWCIFMRKEIVTQERLMEGESESEDRINQDCSTRCLLTERPPGIWCLMCLIGCPFNTLSLLVGAAIGAAVFLPILLCLDSWTIGAKIGLAVPLWFFLLVVGEILVYKFRIWACLKVEKRLLEDDQAVRFDLNADDLQKV